MKRIILSFLATAALLAQTKAPVPAPVAAAAPALPNNWYGAFASYNSTASPGIAAGFTEASLMSSTQQLYSYSTYDITLIKQPKGSAQAYTYQSSPRTGMAVILKSFGRLHIIGFGNIGVATTGSNASFASSGGGLALLELGKSKKWDLFGGFHVLNTGALGGTINVPEFGIGRSF